MTKIFLPKKVCQSPGTSSISIRPWKAWEILNNLEIVQNFVKNSSDPAKILTTTCEKIIIDLLQQHAYQALQL